MDYNESFKDKDKEKVKYLLLCCHANYLTRNELYLFPFHSFVIPVRHPLLSIISILRRHRNKLGNEQTDKTIFEWIHCARALWSKDFPIYVFINPWHIHGFGKAFKRLDIRQNQDTRSAVDNSPVVNKTHMKDEKGKKHIHAIDRSEDDSLLNAKKDYIDRSIVSSSLQKYWDMLESSGLLSIYKELCFKNNAKATPND